LRENGQGRAWAHVSDGVGMGHQINLGPWLR